MLKTFEYTSDQRGVGSTFYWEEDCGHVATSFSVRRYEVAGLPSCAQRCIDRKVAVFLLHLQAHDYLRRRAYVDVMDGHRNGDGYEVVVDAELSEDWARWFQGFEVERRGAQTALSGSDIDQSELHGLLSRLRDLAIPIVGVRRLR
jgi:hypothetical protein